MKANIGALFFHIAAKYDFKDSEGHPIRNCKEIIEFFEIMGPKPKRIPIDFLTISYRLQDPNLNEIYAVNKEQYSELITKEGQSYIDDKGNIKYMENIGSRLKKTPGIKAPYIIKKIF